MTFFFVTRYFPVRFISLWFFSLDLFLFSFPPVFFLLRTFSQTLFPSVRYNIETYQNRNKLHCNRKKYRCVKHNSKTKFGIENQPSEKKQCFLMINPTLFQFIEDTKGHTKQSLSNVLKKHILKVAKLEPRNHFFSHRKRMLRVLCPWAVTGKVEVWEGRDGACLMTSCHHNCYNHAL